MRKYLILFSISLVMVLAVSVAVAKEFITGYDVNNNFAPVRVEKGVYVPGVSLYPAPQLGITTKSNLLVTGEIQAQRIVSGGSITNASSTLTTALTLTAAQVCNSSVITVNKGAVAGTNAAVSLDITMPATTTLFADCLDTEGDSSSFVFVNASPTAASTTEMIAGTGCESFKSQSTGGADTVPGLGAAKITFLRATDYMGVNATNDCIMLVEPFIYD